MDYILCISDMIVYIIVNYILNFFLVYFRKFIILIDRLGKLLSKWPFEKGISYSSRIEKNYFSYRFRTIWSLFIGNIVRDSIGHRESTV